MNELSLFRCLGDATRLAILQQLADGEEWTVSDLVDLVDQERTNVSHHLAQLRACGLVRTRTDGPRVHYALGHAALGDLLEAATELAEHITAEDPAACLAEGCC